MDFREVLGIKELSPSTTPNLQSRSARTGKFVPVSLPYSYLNGVGRPTTQVVPYSLNPVGHESVMETGRMSIRPHNAEGPLRGGSSN